MYKKGKERSPKEEKTVKLNKKSEQKETLKKQKSKVDNDAENKRVKRVIHVPAGFISNAAIKRYCK